MTLQNSVNPPHSTAPGFPPGVVSAYHEGAMNQPALTGCSFLYRVNFLYRPCEAAPSEDSHGTRLQRVKNFTIRAANYSCPG